MKKEWILFFAIVSILMCSILISAEPVQKKRVMVYLEKSRGMSLQDSNGVKEKAMVKNDFGNSFSAELSDDEIKALEKDSRIIIKPVMISHIFLQNSTRIMNATRSWSLQYNNINLTGAGQTVCILDTGINYSHPDLGGCFGYNNPLSSCKVLGGYDYVNIDSDPYDDQGHGTHVAGIVAANGSINGIAPQAKIVMIKVCNATGSCSEDDIHAGIDWCVNNATIFNISVISLSLGRDLFNSYCDNDVSDTADLTSAINNAASKNISVIVASGNGLNNAGPGNYSAIAIPACMSNATPISSTDKSDTIASYADRNSIVQLFATGGEGTNSATQINSTCFTGGYCGKQGTSMAAPHAAGAFAIINQLLKMTGKTKTPQQIESLLNSTGKTIPDSSSGLNFSRINIYNALQTLSFDYVSSISPQNNLVTNQNQTYYCNASSSVGLTNLTFYFWNSSSLEYNSTIQISGFFYSANFSYNFSHTGSYKWACMFSNNLSFSKSSDNFSIIMAIDTANPAINFTSPTETSGSTVRRSNILINVSANDTYLANLTVYLYYSGALINASVSASNITFVNFTNLNDGLYFFNATAYDYLGNSNSTETRNVTLDARPPYYTPITLQNYTYGSMMQFNSYWNDTIGMSSVWLALYTPSQRNYTAPYNSTYSAYIANASGFAAGNYSFQWFANDSSGNLNYTSVYNFSILQADPLVNISFNVSGIVYYRDVYIENLTNVTINATTIGEGPIALYVNGTLINLGLISLSNTTSFNASTVNVTVFYNSTQNYSSSLFTRWIYIESSNTAPTVNLVSPESSYTNIKNITFIMNATDATLKNATLYIWSLVDGNYSTFLTNTTSISGMNAQANWTYSLDDNNYLWNVRVYDYSGNKNYASSNNTLIIDTITPSASLSLSASSIYSTGSASANCTASDTNLDYMKIYVGGSVVNSSTSSGTLTYTIPGSTGIGTYQINCTARDEAGNSNVDNKTLTISSPPSSPGNNIGPTVGTPTITTTPETPVIETTQTINLVANTAADIIIPSDVAAQGITMLTITTSVNVNNVEISLKKIDSAEVSAGGNIYNYFNITAKNLNQSSISSVSIRFSIPKTWIIDNNINKDTIKMRRYTNEWNDLTTSQTNENSDTLYFNAQSPGFSLFAITAEKNAVHLAASAGDEQTEAAAPLISSKIFMIVGLVVCLVILGALVWFTFFRKNEPEKLGAVIQQQ